jgi:alkylation response protein AidB-like acyl-CoA dehydrogenase
MFDFLLNPEQIALRDKARDFARSIPKQMILDMDADKIQFPKEFLQEAARQNLFGLRYPKKWGGQEKTWVDTCVVFEEVGVVSYEFACVFGIGPELVCDAIIQHGTDALKEKYVKPLLEGKIFAAECLTEPRGGSDFYGTTTTAQKNGDYYILDGAKRFIVGGEGADFFLAYAKTDPNAPPHKSLTAFIVDRSEGVTTKYLYGLMGCRGGGTARLLFQNVKVPSGNIVGKINCGREIFNTMMVPERLGTAAMGLGSARAALEIATDYSTKRKAFGMPIRSFQGVNFQIAESVILLDAARSLIYTTARAVDAGADAHRVRRMVSESKKFATEACQGVINRAMQILGGIGYTNVFPIERMARDIRLASIWVGTNEIMNMIIQSEWYREHQKEFLASKKRIVEADALHAEDEEEKVYE